MPAPVFRLPSPVERLPDRAGVRVYLKRDDLIHPDFPGNKWRKLQYNLPPAGETLLTFGGAWSNHLRATAAAGHHFGFPTIGVVRGETRTPVLERAAELGMRLVHVSRSRYRAKDEALIGELRERFGDFHLLPEGGANSAAVRGTRELVAEIDLPFDVLCCACGTGATLAGVAAGLAEGQRAIGFPVLRGGAFLADDIRRLQRDHGRPTANWTLNTDFHFGGFAKTTPDLSAFIAAFAENYGVTLDRVYEAKMMYGLFQTIDRFPRGTTVLALIA